MLKLRVLNSLKSYRLRVMNQISLIHAAWREDPNSVFCLDSQIVSVYIVSSDNGVGFYNEKMFTGLRCMVLIFFIFLIATTNFTVAARYGQGLRTDWLCAQVIR